LTDASCPSNKDVAVTNRTLFAGWYGLGLAAMDTALIGSAQVMARKPD
jgi:hypothetical protein